MPPVAVEVVGRRVGDGLVRGRGRGRGRGRVRVRVRARVGVGVGVRVRLPRGTESPQGTMLPSSHSAVKA